MQKTRKGFTLVELVVVIAVIAILAGVLIGTFASVINKANDSAKVQEIKQQEINQKAEDILKKLEDSNWYGWEDFEADIVAKLTTAYKANASATVTKDDIKAAVEAAINEYASKIAVDKTELTAEQVKAIIENALGSLKYEGITEAQVRSIVQTVITNGLANNLTASQVKQIVSAANANNLTAAQVSSLLTSALTDVATIDELDTKIANAVTTLSNTIAENVLSEEDVVSILEATVPVTKTVYSADEFTAAVENLNSGSTIILGTAGLTLEINIPTDVKTLTVKGEAINILTINAPKSSIYVVSDVTTLNVTAVANGSLHLFGEIGTAVVNKGRVVFETGSSVTGENGVKAAPSVSSTVSVEIGSGVTISKLDAIYQTNGSNTNDWIEITNNGTVTTANLTTVENWTTSSNTTNIHITNGVHASGTTSSNVTIDKTNVADNETKTLTSALAIYDEGTGAVTTYDLVVTVNESVVQSASLTNESTQTSFWGEAYASSFAGGDGTVYNPYEISNATELMRLSKLMISDPVQYRNLNYVLTADIDLTGKAWMPISAYGRDSKLNADAAAGSTSIYWFNGTFDGQGHTITGLNDENVASLFHKFFTSKNGTTPIGMKEYTYGLFGSVIDAKIENIVFENVAISGTEWEDTVNEITYKADHCAALVGFTRGETHLSNITIKEGSYIVSFDDAGGIVGGMRDVGEGKTASVKNCNNYGNVTAAERAAGICGNINTETGTILFDNCHNYGNVKTNKTEAAKTANAAGIAGCGFAESAKIEISFTNCSNDAQAQLLGIEEANKANIVVIYTTSNNYNSKGNIFTDNGGNKPVSSHVVCKDVNGTFTNTSDSVNKLNANWTDSAQ